MIKGVLAVALGAVVALELDKLMDRAKDRFSPRAVTDSLLDKVNEQLEKGRSAPPSGR
jgi:hypothetical protein